MLTSGLTHAHTQHTNEAIEQICIVVLQYSFIYKRGTKWIYLQTSLLNHWFRDRYELSQKCKTGEERCVNG